MQLSTILQHNGFTQKEADVYLAALQLGMAPISVIAKKAGLRRSTAYEILQKLSAKGFAEFFVRKHTRYYSVLPPKVLLERIHECARELEFALPNLVAIHNEMVNRPRITFYEGKEDLKRLYIDVLEAKGEVLNYFMPEITIKYFTEEWLKQKMIEKLLNNEMRVRVIMPDSPQARSFLKERESVLRKQKIVEGAQQIFKNEIVIYDDKVMHFSFDEDFAFLIQSKDVADTHKAIFNLAWESSSL